MRVLLSRLDVFDLTDTLAASGRIRVTPLSGREPFETASFVASSTFELRRRRSCAVAADHLGKYLPVAQFCASAQQKFGIILAVVGEAGERTKLRAPLAPNLVRQRASVFVPWRWRADFFGG
jgi:hypothetical protein